MPYQIQIKDTYLFLVKENLNLINDLIKRSREKAEPLDPSKTHIYYKNRARHLQAMALLGSTCEYLIKIIILNRGYSINEVNYIKKIDNNENVIYSDKVITFEKAIALFKKSNLQNFYDDIKTYHFNTNNIDYEYLYLGYKQIKPESCINLIQKVRNNYLHKADAHGESNGVIWYIYNFIVWLAKKEFNSDFAKFKYIGNKEIIDLFQI